MPGTLIQIQTIPADDFNGLYNSTQVGLWTDYYIWNSYFTDQHIYQMGVASPGGFDGASVAFVQTTAPTLLWQCDWQVERQDASPIIPSPTQLLDPNWVLLDTKIEPEQIELVPNGITYIYRIKGTYWFGHQNPAVAQMVHPIAPWFVDSEGIQQRIINTASVTGGGQFQGGLIDAPA